MKGKRDYRGNEVGIPGGAWHVQRTERHKKLQQFYKTHEWKGYKVGWVKKESDADGKKN